jgi:hypothetical protein
MGPTHTPRRRMLGLTARVGAVVASATLIFTAAAGDAGASTSKFCKDGNSFGNFLNTAGGGRASVAKAKGLAQKAANDAPASAKASWSAVVGDFSNALNASNPSKAQQKQIEKQLTSDIGRAHRSLTKACG